MSGAEPKRGKNSPAVCIGHYSSPLGEMTMAGEEDRLIGLWFDGQKHDRALLRGRRICEGELPVFADVRRWLDIYFSGRDPGFTPDLVLSGSLFRRTVGELMLEIPYGNTVSYGDLAREAAKRLGRERMSAQAVGGAVGHNPISLIVPCHRVLASDGGLTGYAGGLDRKRALLDMEKE